MSTVIYVSITEKNYRLKNVSSVEYGNGSAKVITNIIKNVSPLCFCYVEFTGFFLNFRIWVFIIEYGNGSERVLWSKEAK